MRQDVVVHRSIIPTLQKQAVLGEFEVISDYRVNSRPAECILGQQELYNEIFSQQKNERTNKTTTKTQMCKVILVSHEVE